MVKIPLFARLRAAFHRRLARDRGIAAHFRHVIALAAAAEDREGPAIGDAEQELLISIVVPVFNANPKYLSELLASFQIQPQHLCDLILSDDGSTSLATQRWLNEHCAVKGVTILRNKRNLGISAATNRGIAQAAGRWIALVDHDDALAPYAVSRSPRLWSDLPAANFSIPTK